MTVRTDRLTHRSLLRSAVTAATMVAATSGGVRDSPTGIGRRTHFADTLSLQISPSDLSETRMPVGVLRATHDIGNVPVQPVDH